MTKERILSYSADGKRLNDALFHSRLEIIGAVVAAGVFKLTVPGRERSV